MTSLFKILPNLLNVNTGSVNVFIAKPLLTTPLGLTRCIAMPLPNYTDTHHFKSSHIFSIFIFAEQYSLLNYKLFLYPNSFSQCIRWQVNVKIPCSLRFYFPFPPHKFSANHRFSSLLIPFHVNCHLNESTYSVGFSLSSIKSFIPFDVRQLQQESSPSHPIHHVENKVTVFFFLKPSLSAKFSPEEGNHY